MEMFSLGFNKVCAEMQGRVTSKNKVPVALVCLALVLLAAPLDVLQLACMVIGALIYGVFAVPVMSVKSKVKSSKIVAHATPSTVTKPTAMAIKAPVFTTFEFDTQVDELIERITPTASCHQAVESLMAIVREKMQALVPEAEIMGFTTGNLEGAAAYGVAVPEVDIVVNARPADLIDGLQGRLAQTSRSRSVAVSRLDTKTLQKSVIRVCTSLLVGAGFKFRRSSFRSDEPKVTLLAPASLGASNVPIPIDFSINNSTPLYNMALLTECGQMDLRAKSLIVFVKRWAKDRGVCHASKGHLPPYAWSLLTIYYLQVGLREADGGLPLPALDSFAMSSSLIKANGDRESHAKTKSTSIRPLPKGQKKTMGDLFRGFVTFYNKEFDWRKEAVSVRSGVRAPPNLSLDLHIVIDDDGSTAVAPIIEDPFDSAKNLGNCITPYSLQRFLEELRRTESLLAQGSSLTKLLEPWRPPEFRCEEDQDVAEVCAVDEN